MEIKPLRLGNLQLLSNVLMAPLAGYTCYPFRILCQEMGAGLAFTEMVSANALKYKDKATQQLLFTNEKEQIKAVQLLGGDPAVIEKAAGSQALEAFDIIDLNMGCPVPNIFKSGEGSALLADRKRASAIIRCCKKCGRPVTVKCRIGITEDTLIAAEFAKICEDAGADMITIHGRSRNMMYSGTPYYEQIAEAKAVVSIPVIANGGIFSREDAAHMMKETGADGIMIGRYALENPLIFSELAGKTVKKAKCQILYDQIALTAAFYPESFTITYIRKLASYFMKGRHGMKQYRQQLYQCGNLKELKDLIEKAFSGSTMRFQE